LVEYDVEEFRKLFPKLSKEILGRNATKVNSLVKDPLHNYVPNIYDFLGRVRSVEEGLEVIDYLERKGELSKELADSLREILKTKGIEAFGERREFGYYYKLASNKRRELLSSEGRVNDPSQKQ
jgi:hypothetical protein